MNTQNPVGDDGFGVLVSKVAAGVGVASKASGRAVLVVLIVAVAIGVGLIVPVLFSGWIASLPPAGLALGAAALLGVLRGLFESLPTAWDFIVKGTTETLPKIFAQVAVAALGLGFAYYAAIPSGGSEHSLNLSVSGSLPPLVMNESDALFTAFVVFPEMRPALDAADPQIALMNNLVDSLATCLQNDSDTIELTIRAYASSSGTDAENEALYKGRAADVAQHLNNRVSSRWAAKRQQFKVERREWISLQAMKLRRLFRDTDESGTYLESAGALNRRAEIKVKSAGSCLPT